MATLAETIPLGQIRLPTGEVLVWAEYGDRAGAPVLYHHGWPGSHLEARFAHKASEALGLRLIAPDRPGYGGSTQAPQRTLGSWPADAAALADHLRVDRFAVIGISGGAPYALACAACLPDRVTRVCLVSAMGPVGDRSALQEFDPVRQFSLRLAGRRSPIIRSALRSVVGPLIARHADRFVAALAKSSAPPDRPTLSQRDTQMQIAASFREGLRWGGAGAARDLELYAAPWGLPLHCVTAPVDLWHGEEDRIIPVRIARKLAGQLPTVTSRVLHGEGHYSVPINHLTTILRSIKP